ncbi:hypothetical protein PFISCL1PPCAC_9633, partial [Pristionchus fissidentatus]
SFLFQTGRLLLSAMICCFFSWLNRECKRLLRLDLHSYWEVFILDLMMWSFSMVVSIPLTALVVLIKMEKPVARFYDNVEQIVENNLVRPVIGYGLPLLQPTGQPTDFTPATYKWITYWAIAFIEVAFFHAVCCYYYRKQLQEKTKSKCLPVTLSSPIRQETKNTNCSIAYKPLVDDRQKPFHY